MPDPKQLPFLLQLMDDESPKVRKTVLKELADFGPDLELEIGKLGEPLSPEKRKTLHSLLKEHSAAWLREEWGRWKEENTEGKKLETALSLLADYQNGRSYPVRLESLLDEIAKEFKASHSEGDEKDLANFLFKTKRICGDRENYYNPFNSNLVYVAEEKRGIPISLASLYMLVGDRLGFAIKGCSYPGHFLAKYLALGQWVFVDCFDGGRVLSPDFLVGSRPQFAENLREILQSIPSSREIICRVLRNLVRAYRESGSTDEARLMDQLLRESQKS